LEKKVAALCSAAKFREETSKKQKATGAALLRTEIYVVTGPRASIFLQRSMNFPLAYNARRCTAPFSQECLGIPAL
jgi:hypothetical protein